MTPAVLAEFLLNGLVLGALYVLMALGLSIIFGMVGVINFAHGALFTLGAYAAYQVKDALGFPGALVAAPLLVGVLGMLIEATLLRRLYLEDPLQGLLLTFGLAMVLEQGIRMLWGLSPKQFEVPAALTGALALGPLTYSKYRSFILLAVVLLIVALALFLQKTAIGTIFATVAMAFSAAACLTPRRTRTCTAHSSADAEAMATVVEPSPKPGMNAPSVALMRIRQAVSARQAPIQ